MNPSHCLSLSFLTLPFPFPIIQDYEDKEYNIKKEGKNYWQLGRLGPDLETEELQAKREKADRVKTMAAQVREENLKRAAAAKPSAAKAAKEPTARDRALEFAKNVPKPEVMLPPPPPPPENKRRIAGGAAKPGGLAVVVKAGSDLEALEAQHSEDQQKVDRIRQELARMLH